MRNLIEEVVAREYARLRPTVQDFCGCDICRDDVMVYALNRLNPHYVARHKGTVFSNLKLYGDQRQADIARVLLDGFRLVRERPSAEHPGRS